jgi:hypothetical protein
MGSKRQPLNNTALVQQAPNRPAHHTPSAALRRPSLAAPAALRPADLLALQRSVGNRATARLLAQRRPAPPRATPLIQREVMTKESILLDQIKRQLVKGVFLYYGKSKSKELEEQKQFVEKLVELKLITIRKPKTKENQEDYFAAESHAGFSPLTIGVLQQAGLLMEAIGLVDTRVSWTDYKRDLDEEDVESPGNVKGLGGVHKTTGKKVKTRIQWQGVDSNTGEGTGMTALVLGPDHPLGSTPADNTKKRSRELSAATGQPYIAGHLLNDHLGGPGNEERNITALPKDVNTEQSDKLEEKVKQRVNTKHEIVFYQVEVTYAQDSKDLKKTKHHYAKELKTWFGTYKHDAKFNTLSFGGIPSSELIDLNTHILPIQEPSYYAKQGSGYLTLNQNKYTSGQDRDPKDTLKNTGFTAAQMKIDSQNDLLLKDEKQIKIEFISYAIYSIPIRELNEKIKKLEHEGTYKDKLLNEGALELGRLEHEGAYKDKLLSEGALELGRLEHEGTYKDKLLSEGALEIGRLEHEGTYKDKLLNEGALEIVSLEGQLADAQKLIAKLQNDLRDLQQEHERDQQEQLRTVQENEELRIELEKLTKLSKDYQIKLDLLQEDLLSVTQQLQIEQEKNKQLQEERDSYKQTSRNRAFEMGKLVYLGKQNEEQYTSIMSPSSQDQFYKGQDSVKVKEQKPQIIEQRPFLDQYGSNLSQGQKLPQMFGGRNFFGQYDTTMNQEQNSLQIFEDQNLFDPYDTTMNQEQESLQMLEGQNSFGQYDTTMNQEQESLQMLEGQNFFGQYGSNTNQQQKPLPPFGQMSRPFLYQGPTNQPSWPTFVPSGDHTPRETNFSHGSPKEEKKRRHNPYNQQEYPIGEKKRRYNQTYQERSQEENDRNYRQYRVRSYNNGWNDAARRISHSEYYYQANVKYQNGYDDRLIDNAKIHAQQDFQQGTYRLSNTAAELYRSTYIRYYQWLGDRY